MGRCAAMALQRGSPLPSSPHWPRSLLRGFRDFLRHVERARVRSSETQRSEPFIFPSRFTFLHFPPHPPLSQNCISFSRLFLVASQLSTAPNRLEAPSRLHRASRIPSLGPASVHGFVIPPSPSLPFAHFQATFVFIPRLPSLRCHLRHLAPSYSSFVPIIFIYRSMRGLPVSKGAPSARSICKSRRNFR